MTCVTIIITETPYGVVTNFWVRSKSPEWPNLLSVAKEISTLRCSHSCVYIYRLQSSFLSKFCSQERQDLGDILLLFPNQIHNKYYDYYMLLYTAFVALLNWYSYGNQNWNEKLIEWDTSIKYRTETSRSWHNITLILR